MGVAEVLGFTALAIVLILIAMASLWVAALIVDDFCIDVFIEKHFPRIWGVIREINPQQGDRKSLKAVLQNEREPNVFVYWKGHHFVGFYSDGEQIHVYDFDDSADDVFKTLEKIHGKLLSVVEVL